MWVVGLMLWFLIVFLRFCYEDDKTAEVHKNHAMSFQLIRQKTDPPEQMRSDGETQDAGCWGHHILHID